MYRASRDGFGQDAFHRQCDDKLSTVIIIKEIKTNNVFGGYTRANWKKFNLSNEYAFDNKAFIFSLINPHGIPFKSKVTNPNQAIQTNNGIAFGVEDIRIGNFSNFKDHSFTDIGTTYEYPRELRKLDPLTETLVTDSEYFLTEEIETFQIY